MAKSILTEQLKQRFTGVQSFTKDELLAFYRESEPNLKETTFRWRIYELKEKKRIRSIDKSHFTLSYKPTYNPTIDPKQKEIDDKIAKNFPVLKCCIWSTKWVHEFMLHQPGKSIFLVEPEKEAIETVFHFLQDGNTGNVYIEPEEKEIENYIFEHTNSIIVKPLITKAPIQKESKVHVPTLEKMLVDIFTEKKLFNIFQGNELSFIFNSAFEKYDVNLTRLFYYAKRRGKEQDLKEYLSKITSVLKYLTK